MIRRIRCQERYCAALQFRIETVGVRQIKRKDGIPAVGKVKFSVFPGRSSVQGQIGPAGICQQRVGFSIK